MADDFLKTLASVAREYGWAGDYVEVRRFVEEVYRVLGKTPPDLTPTESDDWDERIRGLFGRE